MGEPQSRDDRRSPANPRFTFEPGSNPKSNPGQLTSVPAPSLRKFQDRRLAETQKRFWNVKVELLSQSSIILQGLGSRP